MPTTIQLKRGTEEALTSANPVLASGEACFETDTGKFKIGDGTTAWNSLDYQGGGEVTTEEITDMTEAGAAMATATDAEAQAALVAPYIPSGGLDSSAVILAQAGDDLLAKYTAAKALTPNGSAKSATNRAALVIMPGTYALSATLTIDADFVDVVGLGAQTQKPAVILTGNTVWCENTTEKNYKISGVSVGSQPFNVAFHSVAAADLRSFENCVGGDYSFGDSASSCFINCIGGDFSFGGGWVDGDEYHNGGEASGVFINCIGGGSAYGGAGDFPSVGATGTFRFCTGGLNSFGGGASASGAFEYCTGGQNAWGGSVEASARIIGCQGGLSAFSTVAAGAVIRNSLVINTITNVGP
jgi:hypothetical protein